MATLKRQTVGLFDFFKRKNPDDKPSPEQTLFVDTALQIISPTVEQFGFVRHLVETKKYFSTIVFRRDKLYVKIQSTIFPTDYPYHYNVVLGEGDSENVFEWDWNSVALWRLKQSIDHINAKKYGNYSL